MTFTDQQRRELKAVKSSFDRASSLRDEGKDKLANYYESDAEQNVAIYAKLFGLDYNTVIDLVFDFDYTASQLA